MKAIDLREEREVASARHGCSVDKLGPIEPVLLQKRLGMATGKFEVPSDIDLGNDEVACLFTGA